MLSSDSPSVAVWGPNVEVHVSGARATGVLTTQPFPTSPPDLLLVTMQSRGLHCTAYSCSKPVRSSLQPICGAQVSGDC